MLYPEYEAETEIAVVRLAAVRAIIEELRAIAGHLNRHPWLKITYDAVNLPLDEEEGRSQVLHEENSDWHAIYAAELEHSEEIDRYEQERQLHYAKALETQLYQRETIFTDSLLARAIIEHDELQAWKALERAIPVAKEHARLRQIVALQASEELGRSAIFGAECAEWRAMQQHAFGSYAQAQLRHHNAEETRQRQRKEHVLEQQTFEDREAAQRATLLRAAVAGAVELRCQYWRATVDLVCSSCPQILELFRAGTAKGPRGTVKSNPIPPHAPVDQPEPRPAPPFDPLSLPDVRWLLAKDEQRRDRAATALQSRIRGMRLRRALAAARRRNLAFLDKKARSIQQRWRQTILWWRTERTILAEDEAFSRNLLALECEVSLKEISALAEKRMAYVLWYRQQKLELDMNFAELVREESEHREGVCSEELSEFTEICAWQKDGWLDILQEVSRQKLVQTAWEIDATFIQEDIMRRDLVSDECIDRRTMLESAALEIRLLWLAWFGWHMVAMRSSFTSFLERQARARIEDEEQAGRDLLWLWLRIFRTERFERSQRWALEGDEWREMNLVRDAFHQEHAPLRLRQTAASKLQNWTKKRVLGRWHGRAQYRWKQARDWVLTYVNELREDWTFMFARERVARKSLENQQEIIRREMIAVLRSIPVGAAIKIQCLWRSSVSRRLATRLRDLRDELIVVFRMETVERRGLERSWAYGWEDLLQQRRRNASDLREAKIIIAQLRAEREKKAMDILRNEAAKRIQCVVRKRRERLRVPKARAVRMGLLLMQTEREEAVLRTNYATTIQRIVRGFIARKRVRPYIQRRKGQREFEESREDVARCLIINAAIAELALIQEWASYCRGTGKLLASSTVTRVEAVGRGAISLLFRSELQLLKHFERGEAEKLVQAGHATPVESGTWEALKRLGALMALQRFGRGRTGRERAALAKEHYEERAVFIRHEKLKRRDIMREQETARAEVRLEGDDFNMHQPSFLLGARTSLPALSLAATPTSHRRSRFGSFAASNVLAPLPQELPAAGTVLSVLHLRTDLSRDLGLRPRPSARSFEASMGSKSAVSSLGYSSLTADAAAVATPAKRPHSLPQLDKRERFRAPAVFGATMLSATGSPLPQLKRGVMS
eukprot:TRINITY_DN4249_c0_g1_i1.p1 TRINITY_DN4249_c0_g1~~TRINITY_DN4249_c0_g1_i1.p1  ORF type:complete len:1279 (+),score=184.92 TRINITY_DN4249_c0_g1_i1:451-3837(+)